MAEFKDAAESSSETSLTQPDIDPKYGKDISITSLITEGRNPRGIPSAKFIVRT